MAATNDINAENLPVLIIKVDGKAIPDATSVYSVQVEQSINRVPAATIVLADGNLADGKFAVSSSDIFIPGASLSIEAGYDSSTRPIFSGIITGQSIRINDSVGSSLQVECRDPVIRMTLGRKTNSFGSKQDNEIFAAIIAGYPGLSSNISAVATLPPQIQYYSTDWDFLLTRADANGLVVNVQQGKINIEPPGADTKSVLSVKYGDNLYSLNADMNAITQPNAVKASAWDYGSRLLNSGQSLNTFTGPGNISAKKLADLAATGDAALQTAAPLQNEELTAWARSKLLKANFSKIRGNLKIAGTNIIQTNKYITLEGLGDRFNGDHLVSGITHIISEGTWYTELTTGLSPEWFSETTNMAVAPASTLVPGATGLFQGIVKQISEDPESQYRILVDIPLFNTNGSGLWARLCNFYASANAGAFFLPETGDEVIIGFLNEDPRYPVILGSVYSSSHSKPFTGLAPNETNNLKAIVSRSGLYIQFNDEDKLLTIATPAGNIMEYSDKDKKISVRDENGNSLVMSDAGILLKSSKDISIEAQQNIRISSSGGDVQIGGVNIKENAQSAFSVNAGASADLNAGGQMALKAGMIMIN